jgi:hypothetical protein
MERWKRMNASSECDGRVAAAAALVGLRFDKEGCTQKKGNRDVRKGERTVRGRGGWRG